MKACLLGVRKLFDVKWLDIAASRCLIGIVMEVKPPCLIGPADESALCVLSMSMSHPNDVTYHHCVPFISTWITTENCSSSTLVENNIFTVANLIWPSDLMCRKLIHFLQEFRVIENKELYRIQYLRQERIESG